jgi:hypothetical protein
LSNNFAFVSYSVPVGITNHYLTGLSPNTSYAVSQTVTGGTQQVMVTRGPGLVADSAGLLSFNSAGQTLSGAPRFRTVLWLGSSLQLSGTGMARLSYRILATTNLASANWITAGSVNADSGGNFQFIDTAAAAYPQRFYRLSWP